MEKVIEVVLNLLQNISNPTIVNSNSIDFLKQKIEMQKCFDENKGLLLKNLKFKLII